MNDTALKERLRTIAQEKGITFNECWKQLLLERTLARIARSLHQKHLVFKGGYLLSYLIEIGRETTDLDFLVQKIKAGAPVIQKMFEEIASIDLQDGFTFQFIKIEELSQPHMNCPGFRIDLKAELGKMKDQVQIDIGVGDTVEPENRNVKLFQYKGKPIFEGEISLQTYPIETIFAEKFETSVIKGSINSRMKDYHDLLILTRSGELRIDVVKLNIAATFKTRNSKLVNQLAFDAEENQKLQVLWEAHLRTLGKIAVELKLPNRIEDAIQEINQFLI